MQLRSQREANPLAGNSWDDWVPQDRLRKNTEENRELARNLKHDMDALRNLTTKKPSSTSHKKKADLASSARDSEERHSSIAVAAGPRGQKRGREYQVESVSSEICHIYVSC